MWKKKFLCSGGELTIMIETINILIIRTLLLLGMIYLFNYILNKISKNPKNTDIKAFLITMLFQIFASIGVSINSQNTTFIEHFIESIMFIFIFLTYIFTKKYYLKR